MASLLKLIMIAASGGLIIWGLVVTPWNILYLIFTIILFLSFIAYGIYQNL